MTKPLLRRSRSESIVRKREAKALPLFSAIFPPWSGRSQCNPKTRQGNLRHSIFFTTDRPLLSTPPGSPVKNLIQILVFDVKGNVVGTDRFRLEEGGQAVVLGSETRAGIEIAFDAQDLFA
jgi:hypothetical protein